MKLTKKIANISTDVTKKNEKSIEVNTDLSVIDEMLKDGFEVKLSIPCYSYYNKRQNVGLKQHDDVFIKIQAKKKKYKVRAGLDKIVCNSEELKTLIQELANGGFASAQ